MEEVKPELEIMKENESMEDTCSDDPGGGGSLPSKTIISICSTTPYTNGNSSCSSDPNSVEPNFPNDRVVANGVATNLDQTEMSEIPPTQPQPAELPLEIATEESESQLEMKQTEIQSEEFGSKSKSEMEIKTEEFKSKSEMEMEDTEIKTEELESKLEMEQIQIKTEKLDPSLEMDFAEMWTEDSDSADSTATLIVTPTRKPNANSSEPAKRKRGYVDVVHSVVRVFICKICMASVSSLEKLAIHLDRQHNIQVQGPAREVDSEERNEKEDSRSLSSLLQSIENKPRVVDPLSDSSESEEESSEEESENSEMNKCDMEASNKELRWKKMMREEVAKMGMEEIRKSMELRCKLCFVEFPHPFQLNEHLRLHQEELLHICPHCGMTFLHEYHLYVHLSSLKVNIPPLEEVPDIPQEPETASDWESLYPVHHCPDCSSTFANRRCLLFHRTRHDGFHRCPQCEKPYLRYEFLRRHIQSVHNRELRRTPCLVPGCGRTFQNKKGLIIHNYHFHTLQFLAARKANVARNSQPVRRDNETSFRGRGGRGRGSRRSKFPLWHKQKVKPILTVQQRRSNQASGPKGEYLPLKCAYCPLRFKEVDGQSNHYLTVHGVNTDWKKPFVCYLCRTGTDQHKVTTAAFPPLNHSFILSSPLIRHMIRYHPHYTLLQMLSFRPEGETMEVEPEVGVGDDNHQENTRIWLRLKCSYCPLRFNEHDAQSKHLMNVHKINLNRKKPFTCYLCKSGTDQAIVGKLISAANFEFTGSAFLVGHMTKYHPKYTPAQMLNLRPEVEPEEKEAETVPDGDQENTTISLRRKCSYCPLRFNNHDSQSNHYMNVHRINLKRKKPFVCYLCKTGTDQEIMAGVPSAIFEFTGSAPLVRHLTKYHPNYTPAQMLNFQPKVEEPEPESWSDEEVEEVESGKEEEAETSLIVGGKRTRTQVQNLQNYQITSEESDDGTEAEIDSSEEELFEVVGPVSPVRAKPVAIKSRGARASTRKSESVMEEEDGDNGEGQGKEAGPGPSGRRKSSTGGELEAHPCPYCTAVVNTNLNRHIRKHHWNILDTDPNAGMSVDIPHMRRCSLCPLLFSTGTLKGFKLHMNTAHPEHSQARLGCPWCQKLLRSGRDLMRHKVTCPVRPRNIGRKLAVALNSTNDEANSSDQPEKRPKLEEQLTNGEGGEPESGLSLVNETTEAATTQKQMRRPVALQKLKYTITGMRKVPKASKPRLPGPKPYACPRCDKRLSSKQNLHYHTTRCQGPFTVVKGAPKKIARVIISHTMDGREVEEKPTKVAKLELEESEEVEQELQKCPVCSQCFRVGQPYRSHLSWHRRRSTGSDSNTAKKKPKRSLSNKASKLARSRVEMTQPELPSDPNVLKESSSKKTEQEIPSGPIMLQNVSPEEHKTEAEVAVTLEADDSKKVRTPTPLPLLEELVPEDSDTIITIPQTHSPVSLRPEKCDDGGCGDVPSPQTQNLPQSELFIKPDDEVAEIKGESTKPESEEGACASDDLKSEQKPEQKMNSDNIDLEVQDSITKMEVGPTEAEVTSFAKDVTAAALHPPKVAKRSPKREKRIKTPSINPHLQVISIYNQPTKTEPKAEAESVPVSPLSSIPCPHCGEQFTSNEMQINHVLREHTASGLFCKN